MRPVWPVAASVLEQTFDGLVGGGTLGTLLVSPCMVGGTRVAVVGVVVAGLRGPLPAVVELPLCFPRGAALGWFDFPSSAALLVLARDEDCVLVIFVL